MPLQAHSRPDTGDVPQKSGHLGYTCSLEIDQKKSISNFLSVQHFFTGDFGGCRNICIYPQIVQSVLRLCMMDQRFLKVRIYF